MKNYETLLKGYESQMSHLLEFFDPLHHFSILITAKVIVSTRRMPRVEGMEPYHVETFFWDLAVVMP